MKKVILISLVCIFQLNAYRIKIRNELDGNIVVNITEGKVTKPFTVRPLEYFKHDTAGCYILTLQVVGGRAAGQAGGFGNMLEQACRDYSVIARFLPSPSFDPITGKEDLEPKIMELHEAYMY